MMLMKDDQYVNGADDNHYDEAWWHRVGGCLIATDQWLDDFWQH